MKKYRITSFLLLIVLLTSCTDFQELNIEYVKHYKFKGFNNNKLMLDLTIPIGNPNHSNIIISEIKLNAFLKNKPLGIVETDEKIIIKRNSEQDYIIPVNIRITNIMVGLSMLSNPQAVLKELSFEGQVKARKGIFIKTIDIDKNMSKQFIRF